MMIVRITWIYLVCLCIICDGLIDITNDVFDKENAGIIAAFGDFNSNKLIDVFRISSNRKVVDILIGQESKPLLKKSSIKCTTNNSDIITSVMPSDYDGDSMMDFLITVAEAGDKSHINTVHILWGNKDKVNCDSSTRFKMKGQPLVMDYNGDMISDLFGMDEKNCRSVWMFDRNRNFTTFYVSDHNHQISLPHSCAFTDLNGDMVADIFITGEKSIEYWINNEGKFEYNRSLAYPTDISHRGQITFGDLNFDGLLENLLPVCKDDTCSSSSIMVWNEASSEWKILFSEFQFENITWGFIPYDDKNIVENPSFPIILRMSDFNMDGYPDFLVVVQSKGTASLQSKALLLLNKPCSECPLGRKLHAEWNMAGLSELHNVQIAAFYDIYENGIMDIIVASYNAGKWKLHALQNTFDYDAYFIKVLVLSGLCYSDCPDSNVPYGANSPGTCISYHTTQINGDTRKGSAVQSSQSAYFSLQLPYVVLGLGETPNFVDRLRVTIPGFDKERRSHEWTQIIPNSQMVIIPHPANNPDKWINKLFVTPSRLVILTLSALVGTCAFICVIIGFLHWKEKRVDHFEKLQEAHRFHFDAM